MAKKQFLAFDLGAESGRAVLGTLEASVLVLEEKHRFNNPTGRVNRSIHWNLLAQWEELKTGLKNTKVKLDGLGVDTWGVDFGLVARDGSVLGNPFMYRDARTDGMMQETFSIVSRERVFEQTGIQFMQLNTLYQVMALVTQRSPLLEAAETLLFMPDLFHFFFTGVRKSEFSIASTSQMYDPRQGRWATDMLEQLHVPLRLLPEVAASGTTVGQLSDDVARECGVEVCPVIAPASHDTASAVAAVPAEGSDWCYISSGTWSLMGVELDAPIINEKSLQYNYTNEGGVGGSIRFLKNIMGLWLVQECRRQFKREGYDHSYSELMQMAERATPFGALIDPDHGPFLTPGDMPGKISRFCEASGQRPPHTRGDFVRSCVESLALTYRRTLEGLQDILGRRLETIHIVGGGCQNLLLNQMTADACDRIVVAGPVEGTAIGNILVQALATGDVKSITEARSVVRNSFNVRRYEPRNVPQWEAAYGRYRQVLSAHR